MYTYMCMPARTVSQWPAWYSSILLKVSESGLLLVHYTFNYMLAYSFNCIHVLVGQPVVYYKLRGFFEHTLCDLTQ